MQQAWPQQRGSNTGSQWGAATAAAAAVGGVSGSSLAEDEQPLGQQVKEGRDALVAFLKQEFGKADVRAAFLAIKERGYGMAPGQGGWACRNFVTALVQAGGDLEARHALPLLESKGHLPSIMGRAVAHYKQVRAHWERMREDPATALAAEGGPAEGSGMPPQLGSTGSLAAAQGPSRPSSTANVPAGRSEAGSDIAGRQSMAEWEAERWSESENLAAELQGMTPFSMLADREALPSASLGAQPKDGAPSQPLISQLYSGAAPFIPASSSSSAFLAAPFAGRSGESERPEAATTMEEQRPALSSSEAFLASEQLMGSSPQDPVLLPQTSSTQRGLRLPPPGSAPLLGPQTQLSQPQAEPSQQQGGGGVQLAAGRAAAVSDEARKAQVAEVLARYANVAPVAAVPGQPGGGWYLHQRGAALAAQDRAAATAAQEFGSRVSGAGAASLGAGLGTAGIGVSVGLGGSASGQFGAGAVGGGFYLRQRDELAVSALARGSKEPSRGARVSGVAVSGQQWQQQQQQQQQQQRQALKMQQGGLVSSPPHTGLLPSGGGLQQYSRQEVGPRFGTGNYPFGQPALPSSSVGLSSAELGREGRLPWDPELPRRDVVRDSLQELDSQRQQGGRNSPAGMAGTQLGASLSEEGAGALLHGLDAFVLQGPGRALGRPTDGASSQQDQDAAATLGSAQRAVLEAQQGMAAAAAASRQWPRGGAAEAAGPSSDASNLSGRSTPLNAQLAAMGRMSPGAGNCPDRTIPAVSAASPAISAPPQFLPSRSLDDAAQLASRFGSPRETAVARVGGSLSLPPHVGGSPGAPRGLGLEPDGLLAARSGSSGGGGGGARAGEARPSVGEWSEGQRPLVQAVLAAGGVAGAAAAGTPARELLARVAAEHVAAPLDVLSQQPWMAPYTDARLRENLNDLGLLAPALPPPEPYFPEEPPNPPFNPRYAGLYTRDAAAAPAPPPRMLYGHGYPEPGPAEWEQGYDELARRGVPPWGFQQGYGNPRGSAPPGRVAPREAGGGYALAADGYDPVTLGWAPGPGGQAGRYARQPYPPAVGQYPEARRGPGQLGYAAPGRALVAPPRPPGLQYGAGEPAPQPPPPGRWRGGHYLRDR